MIRAFQSDYTEDVVRVWLDSIIEGQAFLPESYWRAMEPEIRALLTQAGIWFVEEGGELVAFVATLGNTIGGLFTHPIHQGEGHGQRLVEHTQARFDKVLVEVFEANHRAVGFYLSCGFSDHEHQVDPGSGLHLLILESPGSSR